MEGILGEYPPPQDIKHLPLSQQQANPSSGLCQYDLGAINQNSWDIYIFYQTSHFTLNLCYIWYTPVSNVTEQINQ